MSTTARIVRPGASLTTAQTTAGGTAVPALTAGNALLDASGATVLTKSGTSTAFPGNATTSGAFLAADGSNTAPAFAFTGAATRGFYRNGFSVVFADFSADIWWTGASNITMRSNGFFGIASGTTSGSGADVCLYRDGANISAWRNGTAAQTNRVYGTWTDASNGRWLNITMSTAGVAAITPTGNGTGASGNVLHISGLPTSNPGPGILWNDAGAVKVGT